MTYLLPWALAMLAPALAPYSVAGWHLIPALSLRFLGGRRVRRYRVWQLQRWAWCRAEVVPGAWKAHQFTGTMRYGVVMMEVYPSASPLPAAPG